jgi:hypothetical protein
VRAVVGLLALALLVPGTARAWDDDGHRLVAEVAYRRLAPATRAALRPLLDGRRLSSREVSFWADVIKHERRETTPWHWVNVPLDAPGLDEARDCPEGACATRQLALAVGRLANPSLAVELRREALRFVVHLAADLHQPLHVGDARDRGGNRVKVRVGGGEVEDLHWIWDGPVVHALVDGRSFEATAAALLAPIDAREGEAIAAGEPRAWADEGHVVVRALYAELRLDPAQAEARVLELPKDYAARQRAVTGRQVLRAGLRLARLLDAALAPR